MSQKLHNTVLFCEAASWSYVPYGLFILDLSLNFLLSREKHIQSYLSQADRLIVKSTWHLAAPFAKSTSNPVNYPKTVARLL